MSGVEFPIVVSINSLSKPAICIYFWLNLFNINVDLSLSFSLSESTTSEIPSLKYLLLNPDLDNIFFEIGQSIASVEYSFINEILKLANSIFGDTPSNSRSFYILPIYSLCSTSDCIKTQNNLLKCKLSDQVVFYY